MPWSVRGTHKQKILFRHHVILLNVSLTMTVLIYSAPQDLIYKSFIFFAATLPSNVSNYMQLQRGKSDGKQLPILLPWTFENAFRKSIKVTQFMY